jgi:hypothetical protein
MNKIYERKYLPGVKDKWTVGGGSIVECDPISTVSQPMHVKPTLNFRITAKLTSASSILQLKIKVKLTSLYNKVVKHFSAEN